MRTPLPSLRSLLHRSIAIFVLSLAALAGAAATPARASDYPARPEVRQFIAEMADRHGFDTSALLAVFAKVQRNDDVIRLMTPAPSGAKRSWRNYRTRMLDDARIDGGVRFWRQNENTLRRAAHQYGVPPEIIVAIIGVETIYGRVTGDFRVVDSLATLAFDYPRRAEFFRSELEQFLLWSRQEGQSVFDTRGSYAGAIGLPQFMPGSIRRFAVDFDRDGHIDLRRSTEDAIGSVANFLVEHGWAPGLPLLYVARVPDRSAVQPLIDAGIQPNNTIAQLREYGVSSPETIDPAAGLALIDLPNGDDPPDYWLGGHNFYVITRYNRSSMYAMAVIELAQALQKRYSR